MPPPPTTTTTTTAWYDDVRRTAQPPPRNNEEKEETGGGGFFFLKPPPPPSAPRKRKRAEEVAFLAEAGLLEDAHPRQCLRRRPQREEEEAPPQAALETFLQREPPPPPPPPAPVVATNTFLEALLLPASCSEAVDEETRQLQAPYWRSNPLLCATEGRVVPRIGPAPFYGTPCGPQERLLQVARYGRIYRRKSTSYWRYGSAPFTNAPPGMRYCRFCKGYQPLSAFYTKVRRYICRKHHAERVRQIGRRLAEADPSEAVVDQCYSHFCNKALPLLGRHTALLDRTALRQLVLNAGIPWGCTPCPLPIDPDEQPIGRNVALVTHVSMQLILKVYGHTCSRALFIAHVQRCNLLPPTFDTARPDAPLHDPTYVRQDIDVGPLLAEEAVGGALAHESADREAIEALLDEEPQAHWNAGTRARSATARIAMRARWHVHQRKLRLATRPHIKPVPFFKAKD